MYRVRFIYLHPIVELEDECYLDFDTDLNAWRMYDFLLKSHNVICVRKPLKLF